MAGPLPHVVERQRTVHCADAVQWLRERSTLEGCSVVTSLPDASEFPSWSLGEWKRWFTEAVELVLSRVPDDGVALFFQTDVKKHGEWLDKGYLCQRAAEASGCVLLWHKVIARAPVGNTTFGRPGYSHLLGFSRGLRAEMSKSLPDVLPSAGETTWTRGMGVEACVLACRLVQSVASSRTLVDPFCGHGTLLAVANAMGFDAVGVELSRKRAARARTLHFDWKAKRLFDPRAQS